MSITARDAYTHADATQDRAAIDPLVQKMIEASEARFNDSRMQMVINDFLSSIEFPPGAQVLEIGCGIGGVSRLLAQSPGVANVIGIDQSAAFLSRAAQMLGGQENLTFEDGDGRRTRFDDGTFDVVVLHTVIGHAKQPEQLIAESHRILRPGGCVAVCEADVATVAAGGWDPLQACIDVLPVQNLGLIRRLPTILSERGFDPMPMRNHGYVEAPHGGIMLTWVDRGAEALVQLGRIGSELSDALRAEAARRSASGRWFGHISFFSVLGRKT